MKGAGKCRSQSGPERTCLGCGAKLGKRELLRFVECDGGLLADPAQRLLGRGVYCCRIPGCLKKLASKKGRLSKALRSVVVECQAVDVLLAKAPGN